MSLSAKDRVFVLEQRVRAMADRGDLDGTAELAAEFQLAELTALVEIVDLVRGIELNTRPQNP